MSVVGIDFGNLQTCIAVARSRGINIICKEVSNRFTPSLVGFGPKSRHLGKGAATLHVSNLKNTVSSLKRLVGRPATDATLAKEREYTMANMVASDPSVSPSGEIGVQVQYLGEERTFLATQCAAMYLGKIKQITKHELKAPVSDVVVSVPVWFSPAQRQAMIESCKIASLNPLRIINNTTAAALAYGITKTDLPEEKEYPHKVVFVDIGHLSTSIAAVAFVKGKLQVEATTADPFLSGRDLDQLLINHFVAEFKEKYKFNLAQHPKPLFCLRAAIDKLKKVLLSNLQAPLNIEALFEDRDVSSMITRDEFEKYAEPFTLHIAPMICNVLYQAGWTREEVFCIETVGRTTCVPAIRKAIIKYFERDLLLFTINQDEAVACGCALMCAIILPAFCVHKFEIKDVSAYNATVLWMQHAKAGAGDEAKQLTMFEKGAVVPATKVLTFYCKPKQLFKFEANLDAKATPPATQGATFLSRHTITKVPVGLTENPKELTTLKVCVHMNPNHMVSVESAHTLVEDNTPEEPAAKGNAPAASEEPPKKKHKEVKVRVVLLEPGLAKTVVQDLKEVENSMALSDRLVFNTEEDATLLNPYFETACDLTLWHKPVISGSVFAGSVVGVLVARYYSGDLLRIILGLAFGAVLLNLAYTLVSKVMAKAMGTAAPLPLASRALSKARIKITEDQVRHVLMVAVAVANRGLKTAAALVLVEDIAQSALALIALYFAWTMATYLLTSTLVLIALVLAFAIPVAYDHNCKLIDTQRAILAKVANQKLGLVLEQTRLIRATINAKVKSANSASAAAVATESTTESSTTTTTTTVTVQ
ncbi:adenyl-nucleotide exchange factor sse1 [Blastocladiella emersonii ATCC 22665]|nr:adenyl-nucleotide exchange factor sse1 [Blastocladiella emersonii ATCC 22665]